MLTRMFSPLEQFEIIVVSPAYSFFNSFTLNLGLFIIGCWVGSHLMLYKAAILPLRYQLLLEASYLWLNEQLHAQVGLKALRFFPLYYVLFYSILFMNLIGLLPYGFTLTSQLVWTLCLTGGLVFGSFIGGMCAKSFRFIKVFTHDGLPQLLVAVVCCLELFSYFIRSLSLAVRLFANMVAGHALSHLLAKLCLICFSSGNPIGLLVGLSLLAAVLIAEFFVSVVQAYIFVVLSGIYLRDCV